MILSGLLRPFFHLLYNQMAWTYDLVSWTVSVGQWRSWQRASLPYLRGRRILEVAHGTGNLLLDLVSLGFQPVGLDLSPTMGRRMAPQISSAVFAGRRASPSSSRLIRTTASSSPERATTACVPRRRLTWFFLMAIAWHRAIMSRNISAAVAHEP